MSPNEFKFSSIRHGSLKDVIHKYEKYEKKMFCIFIFFYLKRWNALLSLLGTNTALTKIAIFRWNSKQQWIFKENSMLFFFINAAVLLVQRNFLYVFFKCAILKWKNHDDMHTKSFWLKSTIVGGNISLFNDFPQMSKRSIKPTNFFSLCSRVFNSI